MGSQGDVQPYVALGFGLRSAGYNVRIATHAYFEPLVRSRGLDFFSIAGNPREIVESEPGRNWLGAGRNSALFALRLLEVIKPLAEQCSLDCWSACQGAEAIVASRLGHWAAFEIAEKLRVPLIPAELLPFTPTREFPSPFFTPGLRLGGGFNLFTHWFSENYFWQVFRPWANKFRRRILELPPHSLKMPRLRTSPNLYGYSPIVVPRPKDWNESNYVTGYWFLDWSADWQPPAGLMDFLGSGPPPVCIGFGSMHSENRDQLTKLVVRALVSARQRGILLTGWGGLARPDIPDAAYSLESAPHDWLFPRMLAVVHHGGAGTTAAALRAGVPSIIAPFFGDQMFWGTRVHQLGVAAPLIPRHRLSAERLAEAIRAVAADPGMRDRAGALGQRIRAEDGVARAVEVIGRHVRALEQA